MKKLYEFTLEKEELVKETETTKNDKGEEVTTTKEVNKTVEKKFFLRKPTRKLFDDAELFYGVELSKGIKAGLLTRALLQKRFSNDGGTLGEKEREEWTQLYNDTFDRQVELQQLSLIDKKDRTDEQKEKLNECTRFLAEARTRIQEFEMQQSSLFDQTAENRARNRTILWWVLNLAHAELDGNTQEQVFKGGTYEERLAEYDRFEEEDDDFQLEVINKFFYYVSFWYVSKTSDKKQFEELIRFAEQEDLQNQETEVSLEESPQEQNVEEDLPQEEPSEDSEVEEKSQE